ncbi:hypothetical protein ABPG75_003340 [Micractinium tetrahymenae]
MDGAADSVKDFAKSSLRLVKRCQKPDRVSAAPIVIALVSQAPHAARSLLRERRVLQQLCALRWTSDGCAHYLQCQRPPVACERTGGSARCGLLQPQLGSFFQPALCQHSAVAWRAACGHACHLCYRESQQQCATRLATSHCSPEHALPAPVLMPGWPLLPQKEFTKVARLTAMGFLAVGLIGFLVKVIFIPINQVRHGGGEQKSFRLSGTLSPQPGASTDC